MPIHLVPPLDSLSAWRRAIDVWRPHMERLLPGAPVIQNPLAPYPPVDEPVLFFGTEEASDWARTLAIKAHWLDRGGEGRRGLLIYFGPEGGEEGLDPRPDAVLRPEALGGRLRRLAGWLGDDGALALARIVHERVTNDPPARLEMDADTLRRNLAAFIAAVAADEEVDPSSIADFGALTVRAAAALDSAGFHYSTRAWREARRAVWEDLGGWGVLAPFFEDPHISDILVNGPDRVFVERDGRLEPAGVRFEDEAAVRALAVRLVTETGRRVDTASPCADARLSDGSRINVVLPPLAVGGTAISVRRFRAKASTLDELVALDMLDAALAARLAMAVRSHETILVSGNTGAGKTTLLNALSGAVAPHERVVTIEDAAELKLAVPHVVRLESRSANAEGAGAVTQRDLLVNALRMRPDRIVIGECRGEEALPLLQAVNTGHRGCLTTLHANSPADALVRLETLVLLAAPQWPSAVVRRQIASGVGLVVHVVREEGRRRVAKVVRVVDTGDGYRLEAW